MHLCGLLTLIYDVTSAAMRRAVNDCGRLTLTCTSPFLGSGVASSPIYRFSAGPFPSLINTALIFGGTLKVAELEYDERGATN